MKLIAVLTLFQIVNCSQLERFLQSYKSRHLEESDNNCYAVFTQCISNKAACKSCIDDVTAKGITWTTTDPDSNCDSSVHFLTEIGVCKDLVANKTEKELFCKARVNCGKEEISSIDDVDDRMPPHDVEVDCSKLKKCEWDGMFQSQLGNGQCNKDGCYNTAVCGYDMGDCCEDTCKDNDYFKCGADGYACKDPTSPHCELKLTDNCPNIATPAPTAVKRCDKGMREFVLTMRDTAGDGWDDMKLKITNTTNNSNKDIESFYLEDGFEGESKVCLTNGCYAMKMGGSAWGNEISWELRTRNDASSLVASGGAPAQCNFAIGGNFCETTCDGSRSGENPMDDDTKKCIDAKCPIQMGHCKNSEDCSECIKNPYLRYCYTDKSFVELMNCSSCHCSGGEGSCKENNEDDGTMHDCSNEEFLNGSSGVLLYSACSNINIDYASVHDWDQEHFGKLDEFEKCAHTFKKDGNGKALECMQILYDLAHNAPQDLDAEAPFAIAYHLYNDVKTDGEVGNGLCKCSKDANEATPQCNTFSKFKILLAETLDACIALDEIDCASWAEYAPSCMDNMKQKFEKVDFSKKEQCDYATIDGCGGAGPFPTFRRLDCDKEVDKDAWDFLKSMVNQCNGVSPDPPTPSPPVPTPPRPSPPSPIPRPPKPTPKPYIPSGGGGGGDSPSTEKKGSHLFLWLLVWSGIGFGGYMYYERRIRPFSYAYHRAPLHDGDFYMTGNSDSDNNMFQGLNMSSTSNSEFVPPTVPGVN